MTQKERILELLQIGPVCGTDLLGFRMPRYSARIKELRDDGHTIVTRTCTAPWHSHESHQVEYVLEMPGQMSLDTVEPPTGGGVLL